jgi:adenylate cyclase
MDPYVEALERAVTCYAGRPVLERIKADPAHALELSRKNIVATLFFMDVRSFTKVNEKLSSDELLDELNAYFAAVSEIVVRHDGFIDSLIGDALFAIFGLSGGKHADDACAAAVDIGRALADFNRRPERAFPFAVGIGINTGLVTLGNVGSRHKLKYTAVGDMVNFASRLEGLTREYGVTALVSESTRRALTGEFKTSEVGRLKVKGREELVAVYSLEA